MKKVMLHLILVLIPVMVMAQNKAVDRLFEKYGDKDGYTTVYLTKHMFSLFSNIETDADDPESEDIIKTFQSIDNIRVLSSKVVEEGVNFYDELMERLPAKEYEELMVVHEKEQDTKFLIKKDGEKIKELLMIVGGKSSNALVLIAGDIDLKRMSRISKHLGIEGLENMEKIKEKYH